MEMSKPYKPIRWVRLLKRNKWDLFDETIDQDAKVESPIDENGQIDVTINGRGEKIKWPNKSVSADYPKEIIDKLEKRLINRSHHSPCLVHISELTELSIKITISDGINQCRICGRADHLHQYTQKSDGCQIS